MRSLVKSMSVEHLDHATSVPKSHAPETSNTTFAFVVISHPSVGKDAEVQRQVRSHAAHSWREYSRQGKLQRRGPRTLEPKGHKSSTDRRYNSLQLFEPTRYQEKDDLAHPRQLSSTPSFTSSPGMFASRSPSPGPSPVTYLGGGRIDPFNSCAVQCNTMESFLLDHYFHTFDAKVSSIYTPIESVGLHQKCIPSEWVSFLITDAGILNGVFLRACRTLSVVTSKQYLDTLALNYRARCIESLSSRIASMNTALSTEAIVMMLMLATDEFYMGCAETMRYHVDAMRRVVKLKGGLQSTVLDGLILRLIDWNDLQCTLLAKNRGQPRRYPAVDMLTSGFPIFS